MLAMRQDATNSKLKQCHLELETGVLQGNTAALTSDDLCSMDSFSFSKSISDVIPVAESDAVATVGMTLKMLESLGCVTWRELKQRKDELASRELASLQKHPEKLDKLSKSFKNDNNDKEKTQQGEGLQSLRLREHLTTQHLGFSLSFSFSIFACRKCE